MINHEIIHLINDKKVERGGAQKILDLLMEENALIYDKPSTGFFKNKLSFLILVFLKILRKQPQCVVVHSRLFMPIVLFIRLFNIKTIFYCHAEYRKHAWMFYLIKFNEYVAVSNSIKTYLLNHRIKSHKIHLLKNPCLYSRSYFVKQQIKNKSRCFIGALQPWKGIDILINYMQQFCYENKLVLELNIVGEGPLKYDLLEVTSRYLKVYYHGFVRDPFLLVQSSAIIMIPSLEEGFGLVALEALFHGKIIVYSDIPALKEICAQDQYCFAFNVHEYEAFQAALTKAMIKTNQYEKIQLQERIDKVNSDYSVSHFLSSFQKIKASWIA